ncbi:MAG: hypothetical protein UW37_C0007G0017 [Candidatus Gottesmanbacteria bacterium GW2011_GWA2_44_17]|uniref:Uncharacterized protein n=3 Tax=Candidatus Gottesmaniibacteriota TaxID=1752720 RepID=A0A0G1LMY6_9BACT|nr:MAG: hypothetical protein UV63_C0019G0022 [Microgenomates group bacterium GW2011_GWC1_43_11]KKT38882.1 MAG: hypothetical protein UW22_C0004G0012 [Candidatus Gottesmanbacteria bacterium GW2011_GWB1_44_11c]KKT47451.1 MAG: hypothetical protein UW37_C0007G0017 [Candidatus Gottesmanbacteria bacterium GW2011_GWA2_44_17]KKT61244.1 MAG: hypothetical protein UW52_C0007G0011 [Candidatus Gottesmanbacteria bacterium GW2011_GWA1_44_24b]HCM82464.1 hypothetical protein [Patescibacteria group bacterium]
MKDALYERFQKKWSQTMDLPPQTVGPLTPYYKMVTKQLKVMPLPILFLLSTALIICLFFLIGSGITFLTSLLQRGF